MTNGSLPRRPLRGQARLKSVVLTAGPLAEAAGTVGHKGRRLVGAQLHDKDDIG